MNNFMIKTNLLKYVAIGATTSLLSLSMHAAESTKKKPNILFLPIDDLKPILACYGNSVVKTPNIDRLASLGVVFMNAHCQQAVCGPSRASLLTGLYPDSTGIFDLKTKIRDINPNILTLPQYFSQNGYETAGVGKTFDPRSVDKQRDKQSWTIPYKKHFLFNKKVSRPVAGYQNPETKQRFRALKQRLHDAGKTDAKSRKKAIQCSPGSRPPTECYDVPDDAYADGALTNTALKLLEQLTKQHKPFFLAVGFHKPHLPFVAPKKYWDMYDRSKIKLAPFQQIPKNGVKVALHASGELRNGYSDIPLKGQLPEKLQKELIHGYYASISYVDAQVGRLLDKLDELKIADNTIICLWGDHGWHLGDHGMWCKHSNFEQAVRVPLIIAAPQMKAKGKISESVVGLIDIFPTLCQLADLPIPKHLQGVSLVKILNDPKATVKTVQLSQFPRNYNGKKYMGYTLRSKRYRYIAWIDKPNFSVKSEFKTPSFVELYDYETDPMEKVNIAALPENNKLIKSFEKNLKKCLKLGIATDKTKRKNYYGN
jgi:arylsulfatase A-like enzyme